MKFERWTKIRIFLNQSLKSQILLKFGQHLDKNLGPKSQSYSKLNCFMNIYLKSGTKINCILSWSQLYSSLMKIRLEMAPKSQISVFKFNRKEKFGLESSTKNSNCIQSWQTRAKFGLKSSIKQSIVFKVDKIKQNLSSELASKSVILVFKIEINRRFCFEL